MNQALPGPVLQPAPSKALPARPFWLCGAQQSRAICGSPSPSRFARHRIINSSGNTQTQWLSHPHKKEESLFASSSHIGLTLDGKFVRFPMDLPFNPWGGGAAVQANQRLRHSEWVSLGDLVMGQKRGASLAICLCLV